MTARHLSLEAPATSIQHPATSIPASQHPASSIQLTIFNKRLKFMKLFVLLRTLNHDLCFYLTLKRGGGDGAWLWH
jgi:hypothetical protein